jgi:hypothetical protein
MIQAEYFVIICYSVAYKTVLVPEFIGPVFGLVFAKTGSINSGTVVFFKTQIIFLTDAQRQ